ncbi:MAG: cytochrome c [Dehalococcoidia bacterium]|nr:cytochrome c [Dehalococcoidia bacterium]
MAVTLPLLAMLGLFVQGCSSTEEAASASQGVQPGRAIYAANCARCHGANGEGEPNWRRQSPDETYPAPPHDSSGHTWHHAGGLLYRVVRDGGRIFEAPGFKSAMPAFGDLLSPEETRAVIIFLKTMWGPEERAAQAEASIQDPFP